MGAMKASRPASYVSPTPCVILSDVPVVAGLNPRPTKAEFIGEKSRAIRLSAVIDNENAKDGSAAVYFCKVRHQNVIEPEPVQL